MDLEDQCEFWIGVQQAIADLQMEDALPEDTEEEIEAVSKQIYYAIEQWEAAYIALRIQQDNPLKPWQNHLSLPLVHTCC